MKDSRILIVEDDLHIAQLVGYNLEQAGYHWTTATRGDTVLPALEKSPADLIILDVMLPGTNGFDVCKQIKAHSGFARIPIIMLTAKGEEIDRVLGLELGADDYVVKPFSPRELVLRVKKLLQRQQPTTNNQTPATSPQDLLQEGNLCVDIPRHKVTVDQTEITLTAMEFKLLITLLERRGRVQSREQLLADVWDIAADVTTRTVDTHIKRLRQKLGNSGPLIETVRGTGYRFTETACA